MGSSSKDPYFSLKRAQGILVGVLMLHAAILIVPLIFAALSDYFATKAIWPRSLRFTS